MNLAQKVIKPKLGVLELAKQLGSVSQAYKNGVGVHPKPWGLLAVLICQKQAVRPYKINHPTLLDGLLKGHHTWRKVIWKELRSFS